MKKSVLATTLTLWVLAANGVAGAASGAELSFKSVGDGWRLATFPKQRMPLTNYSDDVQAGRVALRLEARQSYSPLVKRFEPPLALARVAWSWRVAQQGADIDLRTKAGDDTPAKVCVSLAWPDAWVPFVERQLLRLARVRSGDALPGATLCWVWAGGEAIGSVVDNAYTRRVRSIVLRGKSEVGDDWFDEERDVLQDLRQTFGDEWPADAPAPKITAILVAADADNTQSQSIAWLADLRFE